MWRWLVLWKRHFLGDGESHDKARPERVIAVDCERLRCSGLYVEGGSCLWLCCYDAGWKGRNVNTSSRGSWAIPSQSFAIFIFFRFLNVWHFVGDHFRAEHEPSTVIPRVLWSEASLSELSSDTGDALRSCGSRLSFLSGWRASRTSKQYLQYLFVAVCSEKSRRLFNVVQSYVGSRCDGLDSLPAPNSRWRRPKPTRHGCHSLNDIQRKKSWLSKHKSVGRSFSMKIRSYIPKIEIFQW